MHGLKLDLSTAGYFTILPSLILAITSFLKHRPASFIINLYTAFIMVVFLLITLADMEAYKYWGARLDSTPLRFLGKPKEVLASSSFITLVLYTATFIALTWLLYRVYKKYIVSSLKGSEASGLTGMLVFLFLTALLFIPVRGGFGVSPINTGSVYFSKTAFANHSAVNVIWNFGHSLLERKEAHNPYIFSRSNEYDQNLKKLYISQEKTFPVLNNNRPNILLLVLESFSAKLIEPLGGAAGITPQFNSLCREGILFSEIFSTDSRTDKGLATIISGYPVLEAIPIMKYPEKTQNLPFLSRSFMQTGYHATFMYGGDVDFANMRSYLVNGGFGRITSESDFGSSMRTGKWGVPDHFVFDRFLEDVKADTGRWFKVMLTLTNHEPFEIPGKPKFGNNNLIDRFYSAAYYADSCLGDFIRRFKETGLWDNTLIVMIADHGTRLPEFDDIFEPRKHHIPMLWTGGAVAIDTVVTTIGSQADLAFTLLRQTGLPADGYLLGKDLLAPHTRSFAFYSIKNGIAMITDSSGFGYDFITHDFSYTYGQIDSSHVDLARSLQQLVFEHYLNLSELP
jgi:phosphoglycerol transferase MdoB-like AlkP superfamily enzyme